MHGTRTRQVESWGPLTPVSLPSAHQATSPKDISVWFWTGIRYKGWVGLQSPRETATGEGRPHQGERLGCTQLRPGSVQKRALLGKRHLSHTSLPPWPAKREKMTVAAEKVTSTERASPPVDTCHFKRRG